MKVTLNANSLFKLPTGSSTGLHVDAEGRLYVVHFKGVTRINEYNHSATFEFEDFKTPLRKLGPSDTLQIEF